jgi:integrase
MATKLQLRGTRLHSLRHYSATELDAAGIDLRTVAGRLGYGSGGARTLKGLLGLGRRDISKFERSSRL